LIAALWDLDDALDLEVRDIHVTSAVDGDIHRYADQAHAIGRLCDWMRMAFVVKAIDVSRGAVAGQKLAFMIQPDTSDGIQRSPKLLRSLEMHGQLPATNLPDSGQIPIRQEQIAIARNGDGQRVLKLCSTAGRARDRTAQDNRGEENTNNGTRRKKQHSWIPRML
jgi:hypothetical protein